MIVKKVFFFVLLFLIVLQPLLIIVKNWQVYTAPGYSKNYASLQYVYANSQYVKKISGSIPDETLEAFAGGAFLKGLNPIMIVHDQPPLGRYLISLSIFLFDNEKTIPVLSLLISALGIFLIGRQVLKNNFLALIPLGIFINQPMFLNKFSILPLLEPIQLPFIIFTIYFFLAGLDKKRYWPYFILVGVLLGFVISIRYFVLGAFLFFSLETYLLLKKEFNKAIKLFPVLILSALILFSSYFQTIKSGYSLLKILGVQRYIFEYHKSAFVFPLSFWDLILFNRWHTWWGSNAILSDPEWTIFWPLSFLIIIIYICGVLFKKFKIANVELLILLWILFYSLMLSAGYTSTRYFLPLIPFLYILATSLLVKIIRKKS